MAENHRKTAYKFSAENNHAEAFKWFLKGAEEGDAECVYFVGQAHDRGRGVAEDPVAALHWYQKAWEKTYHRTAALAIGDLYAAGRGVAQDYAMALEWYKKISRGNGIAQFSIGQLYERGGPGLAKDAAEAARRFLKAAELGYKGPHENR